MKILIGIILFLSLNNFSLACIASEDEATSLKKSIIHGYITNKAYKPIKLKIFELDKDSLYQAEENLEDNSYTPFVNLKVTAEITSDYSIVTDENNIFIPKNTKLSGHISEIQAPRSFDRRGYFKITFDKAVCPDGENIYLKSALSSRSEAKVYNPLSHVGRAALGAIGGSLVGTLTSLQLGGIPLVVASHGYSLAIGAGTGGFIGVLSGIAAKGKKSTIEPGNEIVIVPVDDVSLGELNQVTCKNIEISEEKKEPEPTNVKVEVLSIKEKREMLGEFALKINIKFTNNSDKLYKLNNFFLKDSQGNEYTTSFTDTNSDIFLTFPPNESKNAQIEFLVNHPKASHWLLLKDQNFNEVLGMWKIKG